MGVLIYTMHFKGIKSNPYHAVVELERQCACGAGANRDEDGVALRRFEIEVDAVRATDVVVARCNKKSMIKF